VSLRFISLKFVGRCIIMEFKGNNMIPAKLNVLKEVFEEEGNV
jgi:hypothetical protein